jgi:hypothetical protein
MAQLTALYILYVALTAVLFCACPFCFEQKDIKTICVIRNDEVKREISYEATHPRDILKCAENLAQYH